LQGFIININKARDEDLIVTVLCEERLQTLYRFYGSRHSTINIGYLIDFEVQQNLKTTISQLKNVLHLAQSWNFVSEKFYIWQEFIKLFYPHLKDVEHIDKFYFELLKKASEKWQKQNAKRVAVESYLEILIHEGRLHNTANCFLCDRKIEDRVALARAYLPAHIDCIYDSGYKMESIEKFFKTKNSFHLDNADIERLYRTLCEGV
jgi:recombinational DNA repair protein (RecF pathway)